jgi:hypothetical protein
MSLYLWERPWERGRLACTWRGTNVSRETMRRAVRGPGSEVRKMWPEVRSPGLGAKSETRSPSTLVRAGNSFRFASLPFDKLRAGRMTIGGMAGG